MLLYLDANCFNRPFDDQTQKRIRQQAEAVLHVLQRILDGEHELVWSSALTLRVMNPLEYFQEVTDAGTVD